MSRYYVAYIDEAGDEGFGKLTSETVGGQSRWLLLGACLVAGEHDHAVPQWRDGILARFPNKKTKDLHFRDLKHDQKVVVCQEMSKLPLIGCVMLSNKSTIPGSKFEDTFSKKGFLYNYLVRWLLERLTAKCAEHKECHLKIVFSRRGGTNYQSMIEYLDLMRDGRERIQPVRSINWDRLDTKDIRVENHSKWAGLQLADCITSAFFSAVEPNRYGNYEPAYALKLRSNMLTARGSSLNSGITLVPSLLASRCDTDQTNFFNRFG